MRALVQLAKTEQAGLCGEDRMVLKLSDRRAGAGIRFGASENQDIGAGHGGEGFAEASGGEKAVCGERAGAVHKKNIDVARELKMLKAVIE